MGKMSIVFVGVCATFLCIATTHAADFDSPKEITLGTAQDVLVTNTSRSPVPVVNTDKENRQFVTFSKTVSVGTNNTYGIVAFPIPEDKIFVVEHVTSEIIGSGQMCGFYVNLSIGNGILIPVGVGTYFNNSGSGLGALPRYTLSKPMKVYVDNNQVAIQAFRCGDRSASATIRSSVSGYFIDAE